MATAYFSGILRAMPGTARFPALDWTFAASSPEVLAEAVGHAWVQQRAGGSVTVVGADLTHPWWPVLREWLPSTAQLRFESDATQCDELPQRPFQPIALESLPRAGGQPWGVAEPLAWLAAREPFVMVADHAPHPALAIALGAVASWGWRVVWRVPELRALEPALAYIAVRQLPLQIVLINQPDQIPPGWWPAPHAEMGLWLLHEWPTLHLPQ